jgi:hypothetical protein
MAAPSQRPTSSRSSETRIEKRQRDSGKIVIGEDGKPWPLPRLPSPGNGRHLIREIDTVHETLEEGNKERKRAAPVAVPLPQ